MPAYSIGKAKREPSFVDKNDNPGIGAYMTDGWLKQSKQKLGSRAVMTQAPKFTDYTSSSLEKVGPSSYNPSKNKTQISATFKGRTKVSYRTDAPSPGSYDPKHNYGSKQYSFGNSRRKLVTKDGPAPNSYTLPSELAEKGVKFSQQQTKQTRGIEPGPGSYHKDSVQNFKTLPEYSFSHQKKFQSEKLEEKQKLTKPGPGAYNISECKQKFRSGKFEKGSRQSMKINDNKVGPGQYSPTNTHIKQNARAVIGRELRTSERVQTMPGPGNYDITPEEIFKKNYGKAVFTKTDRAMKNFPDGPGPGSYNPIMKNKSRESSISARNFFIKQELTPSPQQYNPEYKSTVHKDPTAIMGKQQKSKRLKTDAPGPGSYKLSQKNFSKTFFFNRAKKRDKMNETAGPGQYKLKPYFGDYDGLHKDEKDILYV